jgi:hypothetical protein
VIALAKELQWYFFVSMLPDGLPWRRFVRDQNSFPCFQIDIGHLVLSKIRVGCTLDVVLEVSGCCAK